MQCKIVICLDDKAFRSFKLNKDTSQTPLLNNFGEFLSASTSYVSHCVTFGGKYICYVTYGKQKTECATLLCHKLRIAPGKSCFISMLLGNSNLAWYLCRFHVLHFFMITLVFEHAGWQKFLRYNRFILARHFFLSCFPAGWLSQRLLIAFLHNPGHIFLVFSALKAFVTWICNGPSAAKQSFLVLVLGVWKKEAVCLRFL